MNAIEVNGLYKKIKNFELRNITFAVEQGTIAGFIGQNGAGKSTTIKLLLNLLKKTTGEVLLFGLDHVAHEVVVKGDIGVVFDELHLPDSLTPIEIEKFYAKVYTRWDKEQFLTYCTRFNIDRRAKIKTLSRGTKMKLALILALSHKPKLLLLDEPTSGLDPIVRDEILDELLEFMQDETHTIFFSSHITSDLEKIADTITCIHEGQILFSEPKDVLLYEYGIWKGKSEDALAIPDNAILGKRRHSFGVELLVKKSKVSSVFELEQPTIEEIMIFTVRGV